MLCFFIALRSQKTSNNWNSVEQDFNRTLTSIFSQTDPHFQVFVACHEIPSLYQTYDERLHIVPVDFPIPSTWGQGCRDRALKLMTLAIEVRKNFDQYAERDNSVFIFPVDADDLISSQVSGYVNSHKNANGFKSKEGYIWNKGSYIVRKSKYFGGSCNIMKFYKEELPDALPDRDKFYLAETGEFLIKHYQLCNDDWKIADNYKKMGRPFLELPFTSTIYVLGTGENLSTQDPRISNSPGRIGKLIGLNIHPISFLRNINPFVIQPITRKIKTEFSLW